ncbi:MAG: hypothetical protein JJU36_15505 [Phycisphaeraceae bacterium]|nr:hypothetical protein [Phycisphaeraceae bacterium]
MLNNLPELPEPYAGHFAPLLEALPLEKAMENLVVQRSSVPESIRSKAAAVIEQITDPKAASLVTAAAWLYVDELDLSHRASQSIDTPTGSYWHGIMHRREGDFSNSHYWFNRVGRGHPVFDQVGHGYEPHAMIDQAEAAHGGRGDKSRLADLQRREWWLLLVHSLSEQ